MALASRRAPAPPLFSAMKVSLCFGAAMFALTFWGGGLLASLFSATRR